MHAVPHNSAKARFVLKPLLSPRRTKKEHSRSILQIVNLELLMLVHRSHTSELKQTLLGLGERHARGG
jgi:hypothetical protein